MVTTTTKRIETTKRLETTTRQKIKGCPVRMIPDEAKLKRRNLILRKIECVDNENLERNQCLPKESFVKYSCRSGYKFENNKGKNKSILIQFVCFKVYFYKFYF